MSVRVSGRACHGLQDSERRLPWRAAPADVSASSNSLPTLFNYVIHNIILRIIIAQGEAIKHSNPPDVQGPTARVRRSDPAAENGLAIAEKMAARRYDGE